MRLRKRDREEKKVERIYANVRDEAHGLLSVLAEGCSFFTYMYATTGGRGTGMALLIRVGWVGCRFGKEAVHQRWLGKERLVRLGTRVRARLLDRDSRPVTGMIPFEELYSRFLGEPR